MVVAWGNNDYGQTNVPSGLSNVVAIAAGHDHCLALQANGMVVAWGNNDYGQTNVPSGLSNVVAIAAGWWHSLALQGNGTVVAWGSNQNGQTNLPSGLTNVVAIAAGSSYCLALQGTGMVMAWGRYYNGAANLPMTVPAGLSNVVAIAGGGPYCLGLEANRTVAAWGVYYNGSAYVPMTVPAGLSNVVAIAAGYYHSLALRGNGTVVAWGNNQNGQTNLPSGLTNVVAIAAGDGSSLAVTVGPGPGVFPGPPPTVSLAINAATNLTIGVLSESPFGCRWSLNGQSIAGAAGMSLLISNFDLTKAGVYSVIVTNQDGSATASSVVRLINSPVVLVDGLDAGGGTVTRMNRSQITMSSTFGSTAEIYYTLDGSEPDFTASPYFGAFTLTNGVTIRAIAYNFAYTQWAEASPISLQIWPFDFSFSLTLFTNGNGGVLLDPPTGPYPYGSSVQLTALPSQGYYFFGWANAAGGFGNPLLFTVTTNAEVTALFGVLKANQVSLTVLPNGDGTVAINPARNVYTNGNTVTLTAVPAANCVFAGWDGDASGNSNPLTLLLNTNKLITARFAVPPEFQVVVKTAGAVIFAWSAVTGKTYQVQFKTNLLQTNWSNLGSASVATNGTMTASDFVGAGASQRFYRVALLP
jgi:hypothetical protein